MAEKKKSKKAQEEPEIEEVEVAPEKPKVTIDHLSSSQRAATVVAALGAENASRVYKYLSEEEVEKLTLEVTRLGFVSADETALILDEFYTSCLTQKVVTEGGLDYARQVLEKTYGAVTAAELLKKMTRHLEKRSFDFISKMDTKSIFSVIQRERPQAVALILSYCDPSQAAALIAELPDEKRIKVVESIATMDSASPDVIKIVENQLVKKFDSIVSTDFTTVGGIDYIADVMNNMDRSNEKYIFDEMEKENPILAEEIRKRMFIFEDILEMDAHSIQRFIRECDIKDIVYALKNASQDMMNTFFANMSSRQAETVQSDLEITFNLKLRDVEAAQQKIVGIIRKLDEEGELIIGKGGKDDIIV